MNRNMLWVTADAFSQTGPDAQAAMDALVDKLGPTDFNVIFLTWFHVAPDGAVTYNSTPVDQLSSYLPTALARLKTGFPVKKQIVLSTGGWEDLTDFDNLEQCIAVFAKNFSAFAERVGVDGLDLDFEGDGGEYDDAHCAILANVINAYAAAAPSSIITCTPYLQSPFWTQLLTKTATKSGNKVSWFNLMFYMGTYNYPTNEWAENFQDWVASVADLGTGISEILAPAFIAVGCYANGDSGSGSDGTFIPADLQSGIVQIRQTYPTMGGAFIWADCELAPQTAQQWASAITDGLEAVPTPPDSGAEF